MAAAWVRNLRADGTAEPVIERRLRKSDALLGRAPVLIVQGLDDVSAPPANGRLLKQELGDRARLVEIPRVAHALPIENPEAVARAVLDYLATLRPAP